MFTLDQARGFVAVAEELHFSRAAERLQMTQPPLSRQIQKLERAVGVKLLERNQRSVSLTAAGHVFLHDARRMLAVADSALTNAQRVGDGEAGSVRIGYTAGAALAVLPSALDLMARSLPQIHLDLVEMVTGAQVAALTDGTIDVGLARPPFDHAELASEPIRREEMLLAVPTTHRWARLGHAPTLSEVVAEPLVMWSPTSAKYFHDLVMRVLPAPGPTVVHTVSQALTMLCLVAGGSGNALVPGAARRLGMDGVALLEPAGMPVRPVELHLVWSRTNGNPAARSLVRTLLTAAAIGRSL